MVDNATITLATDDKALEIKVNNVYFEIQQEKFEHISACRSSSINVPMRMPTGVITFDCEAGIAEVTQSISTKDIKNYSILELLQEINSR